MGETSKDSHRIEIENRKHAKITGIEKMLSITETQIILETMGGVLQINGTSLNATKLSVETGELIIEGVIASLKYADAKQKGGLIKRIFK